MLIRPLDPHEALLLRSIFYSSVHTLATSDYSLEQRQAWAPIEFDRELWVSQLQTLKPWVIEVNGELVAYGDLQADGRIDHFYVCGLHGRRGYGSRLLAHLIAQAQSQKIKHLTSKVSRTAQPLFSKFGFSIGTHHRFWLRGVLIDHADMRLCL